MLNILSFVVAVVGVVGLLFSLRQAYRARLRQFEEKYVERYWSILDKLSLEALRLSGQSLTSEDEQAIRRYILLCEDELEMRKSGYISDATYYVLGSDPGESRPAKAGCLPIREPQKSPCRGGGERQVGQRRPEASGSAKTACATASHPRSYGYHRSLSRRQRS
jgi:hypothetical protein